MSTTAESFDALHRAIQSLWPPREFRNIALDAAPGMLLLTMPNDVAAFAVFYGDPDKEFRETYGDFKRLYRENHQTWDQRTLSFVLCRSSEHAQDDRFFAELENDPLFCRKYVIRAHDSVAAQREELLRLPFLPLPSDSDVALQRPQSAQDVLQAAGVSASFSRSLIEAGHKAAERIALEIREGRESLPKRISQPHTAQLALNRPRAHSRLVSMTVEGFRAYRDAQEFDLDASVIVLYGPNGLGKTSLFDAIDYAATGRIGRLCRTRRSQTEFARIATHLDKAPGSGSVTLMVREGNFTSSASSWKLQRSTGDWSTAWADGQELDRKEVLNRLTQANWLDASPRQQTLESLFRATHLFGQGEQELLTGFQKGSVIPEAFIGEMLALQDYTQGLSKVADVLKRLSDDSSRIAGELSEFRVESSALTESLPITVESADAQPTPLEALISDLREQVVAATATVETPPESSTLGAYSEWHEVMLARLRALDERIQVAHMLSDELPAYRSLLGDNRVTEKHLEEVDAQLKALTGDEANVTRGLEANVAAQKDAEARLRRLEQRRQDIRAASEAQAEQADLSKQTLTLQAERDRQLLARSEADSRLVAAEATLSKALAEHSEAQRAVGSVGAELGGTLALLGTLPQFAQDTQTLTDLQKRITEARVANLEAEERHKKAQQELQTSRHALQVFIPEYERALAEQAEIERLLDDIQGHVHDKSCPLCGAKFKSGEELLERIRRQRDVTSRNREIAGRHQALSAAQAQAEELVQLSDAELASARTTIEELSQLQASAQERADGFRTRLSTASIKGSIPDELGAALASRQHELQTLLRSDEALAQIKSRELKSVQDSQAEEVARRRTVNERIIELERRIRELQDRMTVLQARVSQVLPSDGTDEPHLPSDAELVQKSIEDAGAAIAELQSANQREVEARDALNGKGRGLSQQRTQILTKLSEIRQSIAGFRQRLHALELSDDVSAHHLEESIRQDQKSADAIHQIAEQGRIVVEALGARETRLQVQQKQHRLELLKTKIAQSEEELRRVREGATVCDAIEKLLKRERQNSIEKHIAAYGPMITMIQQRLRSVYGFGSVQLQARGGEANVRVEWRNKSVQVPPTDFFSDSQRQILMLSIFLAGGLRQNWSGFAPVLLDDPVTHFDDLNAYAFVELVRGIIATSPHEWQFIISTCEHRLFDLMKKKFSRLQSDAIFYEFLGMSEKGPIVERK